MSDIFFACIQSFKVPRGICRAAGCAVDARHYVLASGHRGPWCAKHATKARSAALKERERSRITPAPEGGERK